MYFSIFVAKPYEIFAVNKIFIVVVAAVKKNITSLS